MKAVSVISCNELYLLELPLEVKVCLSLHPRRQLGLAHERPLTEAPLQRPELLVLPHPLVSPVREDMRGERSGSTFNATSTLITGA